MASLEKKTFDELANTKCKWSEDLGIVIWIENTSEQLKKSKTQVLWERKAYFLQKTIGGLKRIGFILWCLFMLMVKRNTEEGFLTYIGNSINWKIPTITITDDNDDFWTVLLLITQEVNWRKSPEFLHLCWLTGIYLLKKKNFHFLCCDNSPTTFRSYLDLK